MECKLLDSQIYIATTGEYRLCCVASGPSTGETVHTHTPIQWLNSKTVTDAKEQFSGGVWPSQCSKCRLQEEGGFPSKRTTNLIGPGITHLDLRFGNSCNFKCISCYSGSSSSINTENIQMQAQGLKPLHKILNVNSVNWYDEKYFDYFLNLPLVEVSLAGGEPMMIKHLPEFLSRLDSSTHVRITTNGSIYNKHVITQLKRFKSVTMSVSIDAVGRKNDYIRFGSDFETIHMSTRRFSEIFNTDVNPCFSVLNALYYDELIEWCSINSFKLNTNNTLIDPAYLNISNSPDSLKEKIKNFDQLVNIPSNISEINKFVSVIQQLDSFRGVRIRDYLPEVADCYGIS